MLRFPSTNDFIQLMVMSHLSWHVKITVVVILSSRRLISIIMFFILYVKLNAKIKSHILNIYNAHDSSLENYVSMGFHILITQERLWISNALLTIHLFNYCFRNIEIKLCVDINRRILVHYICINLTSDDISWIFLKIRGL